MNFTIKKLGGEFNVEGKDLKEIIKQASLIQQLPEKCSLCSGEVRFDFRSPKGFDYYSIRCTKCGATRNFGISKEDNNLFLRWDEGFAKYTPKAEEGRVNTATTENAKYDDEPNPRRGYDEEPSY